MSFAHSCSWSQELWRWPVLKCLCHLCAASCYFQIPCTISFLYLIKLPSHISMVCVLTYFSKSIIFFYVLNKFLSPCNLNVKDWIHSHFLQSIVEQITYTPIAMTSFYFGMTLLEGRTIEHAKNEVKEKFWPTYKVSIL